MNNNNKNLIRTLIRECISEILTEEGHPEPYDDKTDTFQPSPRDRMEPSKSSLVTTPTDMSPETKVSEDKGKQSSILTAAEKQKINKTLTHIGLDGNGRFEKVSRGLLYITRGLDAVGFSLDMVSGDIIMGDKGSRMLPFRRKAYEGQDVFTENPEIENSRIYITWENLTPPRDNQPTSVGNFEIIAYAT
jgi:hypothetical protein